MRAPIGYDPKGMQIYKVLQKTGNGAPVYSEEFDETIRYFLERIGYDLRDAREYSDETARTDDGRFTFEQIRKIEPLQRLCIGNSGNWSEVKAKEAVIRSRILPSAIN